MVPLMRIPNFRGNPAMAADIGLLIAFRMSAIVVGLIYVKIYTGHLTPRALGIFFYMTTLSYLMNALIFVPFDYYIQAYCSSSGDDLPVRPIVRMTVNVILMALALAGAIGGLLVFLGQLSIGDVVLLYIMSVLLFACTSLRNLLNNRGHRRVAAASLLVEAIGRVSAFLTFLLAFMPSGQLLFGSAAAALAVELLMLVYVAVTRLRWRSDMVGPVAPSIFGTTGPVSGSAACNLLQLQGYRTLYPWSGVPTTAALFAVVANIGAAGMMAAGQVFSQMLLPRIYQSKGDFIHSYVKLASLLVLFVALSAWAISPWLVPFMTSSVYSGYAGLIVFGVIMEGANLIVAAIAARAMLRDETSTLIVWNVAGALVAGGGYAVSIALLPDRPVAIGISLALSQAVVVGGLMFNLRRKLPPPALSNPIAGIHP